ncbi:MAG: hypothetical protein ABIJ81_04210 [Patescibacteria group bacterium]
MFSLVGIIGVGTVGGALSEYFKKRTEQIVLYDTLKKLGSPAEVNRAEIVFICVPTPFVSGKGFDSSAIEEAVGLLVDPKVVVIKSTVLPGTTERLQAMYPQHQLLMNPEFLREDSAVEDMINPERQIVGYTKASRRVASQLMSLLPPAKIQKIVTSTEAEVIKYFGNAFLATKVMLANQFYDLCQALGADYRVVRKLVGADERIGPSHLAVAHGRERGYGGKCLPKDIKTIISLAEAMKVPFSLLTEVDRINSEWQKK